MHRHDEAGPLARTIIPISGYYQDTLIGKPWYFTAPDGSQVLTAGPSVIFGALLS
jgi:hypothetical protein